MAFGKTITMFLIEGEASGRMTCELSNWTGLGYRLPRNKVKNCDDREDLKGPAVYMLFGTDDDGSKLAYIGESEEALTRLKTHVSEKDFWNEVLVFVSKDNSLNKAHVKYLEARLIEVAKEREHYQLNQNSEKPPRMSESERATMEQFLENIVFLVDVLGHKIFEDSAAPVSAEGEQILFVTKAKVRGCDAKGYPTTDGFKVLAGSKAATEPTPTIPKGRKQLRDRLITEGILLWSADMKELTFEKSHEFTSASAAAAICLAASANGLTEWVTEKGGVALKDFEAGNA